MTTYSILIALLLLNHIPQLWGHLCIPSRALYSLTSGLFLSISVQPGEEGEASLPYQVGFFFSLEELSCYFFPGSPDLPKKSLKGSLYHPYPRKVTEETERGRVLWCVRFPSLSVAERELSKRSLFPKSLLSSSCLCSRSATATERVELPLWENKNGQTKDSPAPISCLKMLP